MGIISRKSLRRAATWIGGGVATLLIVDWIGEWLRQLGYYDDPAGRVERMMATLREFLHAPDVMLVAGIFVGIAAGMWLDTFLWRKDRDARPLVNVEVVALKKGYYDDQLRKPGDVFRIDVPAGSRLPSWVRIADAEDVEIAQEHERLKQQYRIQSSVLENKQAAEQRALLARAKGKLVRVIALQSYTDVKSGEVHSYGHEFEHPAGAELDALIQKGLVRIDDRMGPSQGGA